MVEQQLIVSVGLTAFGLLALAKGLPLINAGRKARGYAKRIDGTETRAVGELRPGPVVVEGRADASGDGTVEAPVSGGEALATVFGVEAYEEGLTTVSEGWEERFETGEAAPFTVDDGTGTVLVEAPTEGEFGLETEEEFVGSDERPPPAIRQYVEARADGSTDDLLSVAEPRRYSEGTVAAGDDVVVVGEAREAGPGWSDHEYVIDGGDDPGAFVLSDDPEEEIVSNGRQGGLVLYALGGFFSLVGTVLIAGAWLA